MVSIFIAEKQYKIYTIMDEMSNSQIEVVPERGAIITGWQVQGKEILYLDKEGFANPALSIRGGIPILFPICGNLPNNIYTYKGNEYTLKQHGFARDLPWNIDLSTEWPPCRFLVIIILRLFIPLISNWFLHIRFSRMY